jgi:hypothetical protein
MHAWIPSPDGSEPIVLAGVRLVAGGHLHPPVLTIEPKELA